MKIDQQLSLMHCMHDKKNDNMLIPGERRGATYDHDLLFRGLESEKKWFEKRNINKE